MKKIDKKYIQIGTVTVVGVCVCILFCYILFNNDSLLSGLSKIKDILTPIILGIFTAYILNPLMRFFEQRIFLPFVNRFFKGKHQKRMKKLIRPVSTFLTIALFILAIYAFIIAIIPQVSNSIEAISPGVKKLYNQVSEDIREWNETSNKAFANWLRENRDKHDGSISAAIASGIQNMLDTAPGVVTEWFKELIPTAGKNILGGIFNAVTVLINFIVGIIVAVYLLLKKELFCAQAKKIVYALFKEERANNLINNTRFANNTFGGFLTGKIIDSIIIGVLCFLVLYIFRIPYAVLISVIVGVTNVIPYFGPFIGAIPSAIILLVTDIDIKTGHITFWGNCLTFLIIILIIQQLDGNVIGPKILGDSTGLSSFWVIFSITLFGGLWGVFGMFIGVPLFAVIYAAIKTFVDQRLKNKKMPSDTTYYMSSDYHSDDSVASANAGSEIKFAKKENNNS